MSLTLVAPPAPMSSVAPLADLGRIADEVDLDGDVRVAGELVRGRFLTAALADALYRRYFRNERWALGPSAPAGRRGSDFCRRLAGALHATDSRFTYRIAEGVPSFVVASNPPTAAAATCFLHLHPGTAPEVFARLVGTLDGYGIGFSAELAGDPAAACARTAPSSRSRGTTPRRWPGRPCGSSSGRRSPWPRRCRPSPGRSHRGSVSPTSRHPVPPAPSDGTAAAWSPPVWCGRRPAGPSPGTPPSWSSSPPPASTPPPCT
jgi:hypothetical protein